MGIKETPTNINGLPSVISGRAVEREQARLAREAAASAGGVRRNTLCKCGCGFPTGQRNGYVRLHTPKASPIVKLRKDGHGGYLWTDGTGAGWSIFTWSWPTEKPFGMGPREWESLRAPEWFERGLIWHLNGPDGNRVKSFRSLLEIKQHLAQL